MKTNLLENIILVFVFILIFDISKSQNLYYPLSNTFSNEIEINTSKQKNIVHTSFKPLLQSELKSNYDSILYGLYAKKKYQSSHKKNIIINKLFFENFFEYKNSDFFVAVNPLFYLEKGKDTSSSTNLYINTRGIEIKGNLGKKISYYSSFRENQAHFQEHINTFTRNRKVIPGQGATKGYFTDNHDYSMSTGYLTYTVSKNFTTQIAYDKNFIGNGYRSMLLSDNTFNYPFVKFTSSYKNFKYTTLFSELQDFNQIYYSYHFKKHLTVNYLSYSYKNYFEIGFFEGNLYKTQDTAQNYYNKFPVDFFIPVTGVRTAINGFESKNKTLTGLNMKTMFLKNFMIFSQIASDNFKNKQFAFQYGIKIFDLFFGKINNTSLFAQFEYNKAQNQIYTNSSDTLLSWTHYNQEIAHPAGTDFDEIILNLTLKYKYLHLNFKQSELNLNKQNTYSDIYKSNTAIYTAIPTQTVKHKTITIIYTINPATRLQIYAGADIRKLYESEINKNTYYFFGLRTDLNNFYFDF